MADRKGNYLKRPGRSTAPAALVSVVATTTADPNGLANGSCELATLRSLLVCVSRRARDKWTGTQEFTFDCADTFWKWFEQWCQTGRRTHVVCPTASEVLTLAGFWGLLENRGARWVRAAGKGGKDEPTPPTFRGYTVRRRVLSGCPDIFDYSYEGKSVVWVSARNFYSGEPSELLAGPGLGAKEPGIRPGDATQAPASAARTRCRDTLAAFQRLSDWWLELKAGSFALTVGALAERFLRSRVIGAMPCTHKNPDAQRLERLAAHRGRTQCWFYGTVRSEAARPGDVSCVPPGPFPCIPGEAIHIDVRSMYPYLLATTDLPVKVLATPDRVSVEQLRDYCQTNVCTARVLIESGKAEFPHRCKEGIIYPVGRFSSYLSGLELKRAVEDGDVAKVYECAVYQKGRPFAGAAEELMFLRTRARMFQDDGWELFIKLMSNSMTGKMAQNPSRWVERPFHAPLKAWGEWPEISPADGTVRRFRATAGLVEERVRGEGGRGTLTACYGHLTAACSYYTRKLRELMPPRSVLSLDTDGMWVLTAGLAALEDQGVHFGDEPGSVRVTARSQFSRFWGPKHYYAGRRWVLSGFGGPRRVGTGVTFTDRVKTRGIGNTPVCPPPCAVGSARTVTLALNPVGGSVGADGWLVPRVLPAVRPGPAAVDEDEETRDNRENQTGESLFD